MNQQWWCPKCHRTYLEGQQRGARPMRLCHYSDCNCVADFSQISWANLRNFDPTLQETPGVGMRYEISAAVMQQAWKPAHTPTREVARFRL
ncbi:MAG: hypothetical protein JWN25_2259 [Verrucomicrobiales bacterium]|jgi:hypothetical protein|nr:hypothetical protein [Verrucomicrobiales bacterium]MDB6129753.1 hypothetical protein [Verrucomicrobiales bacterium]